MADVFLTGKIVNVYVDRDTEFSITLPQTTGVALTNPVLEVQRIRTSGATALPAALVPTATIVGDALKALWTAVQSGAMQDLVSPTTVARFRFRMRAQANGAPLRTFVAGKIHVGPVGFASGGENLVLPIEVLTGNIIVGDVTIIEEPEVPVVPGTTPVHATKWDTDDFEKWDADDYVVWPN